MFATFTLIILTAALTIPEHQRDLKRPTILCVAPFNNPHIVPFYEEVALADQFDTTLVSLGKISDDRKRLGWAEMEETNHWLQPWRSRLDWIRYLKKLLTADIVVFPGFFHTRFLPVHHFIRRITFRKTILWSEPFLNHPRSENESKLKRALRRIALAPFNTSRYSFLAMGMGAEDDYRKLGMSRWRYRQFLFSVQCCQANPTFQPPAKDGVARIIYSGSLVHRKGVDILLRAVSLISLEKNPFHLTILGDGPERKELECLTEGLGLVGVVSFIGSKSVDEVSGVLLNHDILVLPSRFDGWGAVVNEAMECSLAVIVSDQVGSRRPLIVEGVNGFVFEKNSVRDLSEKLLLTISDLDTLQYFKAKSRERIEQFSPFSVAQEFVRFCEAIESGDDFSPSGDTLGLI